jgi:hypothetical protein
MSANATPRIAGTNYTPAPPATVDALLTALLHGVPFLAPPPAPAAGTQHPPAWFQAAAWPMVPARTHSADAG